MALLLFCCGVFCLLHAAFRWSLIGRPNHPARFSKDPFSPFEAFYFAANVMAGIVAFALAFNRLWQ